MNMRHSCLRSPKPGVQRSRGRAAGFTLVELMIAMLLGLIVIGGVVSIFAANQQSSYTNTALGEVESSSRAAFELMARDIRDAGLTGCGNNTRVANVVNNLSTGWWFNWNNALIGYDPTQTDPSVTTGTATTNRVSGTSSLMLLGVEDSGLSVASENANAANFKLNETTSDLQTGDIIVVCNPDHATIVQITNYNNSNVTLVHNDGNPVSPGNCSKGLGYPTDCSSSNGNSYSFGPNSQIDKLTAADWYIGYNPAGTKSLYRTSIFNPSQTGPSPSAQEMVRNVTNMQIQYLQPPNTTFKAAANITNWAAVNAVQVTLTIVSTNQHASTSSTAIQRSFVSTITVRNRVL